MPRRLIAKRVAVWTAAAILALVLYVAGAPIVISFVMRRFPVATPALHVVYAPLEYYVEADLPGSQRFVQYVEWCFDQHERLQ